MSMTDYDNYDFWNPGEPDLYKDMEDEERIATTICHIAGMVICFFIMLVLCAMCSSCTTTRYVPRVETHDHHHWHTDSIYQTDSIIRETTTIIMQLDSEAMAKYGIHLKGAERAWMVKTAELERQLQRLEQLIQDRDTVHDSIPIPYPVETIKEVEKPMAWWQKTLMWLGVAMIGIIAVWIWRTK